MPVLRWSRMRAERRDLRHAARSRSGGAVDDLLERRALVRRAEAGDVREVLAPGGAVLLGLAAGDSG